MEEKVLKEFVNKLEKLRNKIDTDYSEYEKGLIETPIKKIINEAYYIAITQNFYDAITEYLDYFGENDIIFTSDFMLDENTIDKIINYDGNVLEHLREGWLGYRHPEYYNFWYSYFDDLATIIEDIMRGDE